jgi:predicted PurR-regulated permease PerM
MLSHIGASFYGVILPELVDVVIVYTIAIALDNFVSYPMIFSNSLKVHPLELFFVILSGAQLAGLPGMMVAAPAYTVLRILAKETLSRFEVIQNITRKI